MAIEEGHAVADELSADPIIRREPMVREDPFLASQLPVRRDSQIRRAPSSSGLYDVLDLILDKGMVIDAFVRVSLVGIELLTIDARVVIASVDTYLRYAEGVKRLDMFNPEHSKKLPDVVGGGMKQHALAKGAKTVKNALTGGGGGDSDDDEQEDDEGSSEHAGVGERLADGVRHVLKRGVGRIMEKLSGEESDDGSGDEQDEEQASDRGNGSKARSRADDGGGDSGGKFNRHQERLPHHRRPHGGDGPRKSKRPERSGAGRR